LGRLECRYPSKAPVFKLENETGIGMNSDLLQHAMGTFQPGFSRTDPGMSI
jgi:hypothetical protein